MIRNEDGQPHYFSKDKNDEAYWKLVQKEITVKFGDNTQYNQNLKEFT